MAYPNRVEVPQGKGFMNYIQWIAAFGIAAYCFILGYIKGYKDAKLEWYYRGKNVGEAARSARV